jgi:cytidine deaminase
MTTYFEKLKVLQQHAYAPYSTYQVASILVTENGDEYSGVNVENASFGGTICAERSAFVSAISQVGQGKYRALHLMAGDSMSFATPCGICRQVISELVDSGFEIIVYNTTGATETYLIDDLLPHAFSKLQLDG